MGKSVASATLYPCGREAFKYTCKNIYVCDTIKNKWSLPLVPEGAPTNPHHFLSDGGVRVSFTQLLHPLEFPE